MLNINTKINST